MEFFYGIGLILIIAGGFFIVPFYLTDKFRKNKASKYIPAILCLISIFILYIKATFFRVGYSSIVDIVFIMLFAVSFIILLFIALILEFKKV